MPLLFSLLGGAGIAYFLIETDLAIPAFIAYVILIALMWFWPMGAVYYIAIVTVLIALWAVITFWEVVAGVILGIILFLATVVGLLHMIHVFAGAQAGEVVEVKQGMPYAQRLDFDTCGEAVSDDGEYNYYQKKWTQVSQDYDEAHKKLVVVWAKDGNEVELRCENGMYTRTDRKPHMEVCVQGGPCTAK